MSDWLEQLEKFFAARAGKRPRKWLLRNMHLSSAVLDWLNAADRTDAQRLVFAELLLKLDADPVSSSIPLLNPQLPRGTRWIASGPGAGAIRVIFTFDPAKDELRLATCSVQIAP